MRMTIGTWLFTKRRGELVGTDAEGNRYFQDKRVIAGRRRKRWVMYNGVAEASRVPPDWHGWLHYTTDEVPPPGGLPRQPWQKEHLPNLSGTDGAYRPPGHTLSPGEKPKPPYEAWRPG
jgi:NADH:ubiquinone oxidoreductase subunit